MRDLKKGAAIDWAKSVPIVRKYKPDHAGLTIERRKNWLRNKSYSITCRRKALLSKVQVLVDLNII